VTSSWSLILQLLFVTLMTFMAVLFVRNEGLAKKYRPGQTFGDQIQVNRGRRLGVTLETWLSGRLALERMQRRGCVCQAVTLTLKKVYPLEVVHSSKSRNSNPFCDGLRCPVYRPTAHCHDSNLQTFSDFMLLIPCIVIQG